MDHLPLFPSLLFGLTTIVSIIWFYLASKSRIFLFAVSAWAILQSMLALLGFYQDTTAMPPRIMVFGVLPALIAIVVLFLSSKGRLLIDRIDLKTLTWFHSVRIPVEIVLAMLYAQGLMSVFVTFHGANFDIISGITASVIALIAFQGDRIKKQLLLGWNIVCLLLLINVVVLAILSAPTPFQQLSLEQPNMAILSFPVCLLPTVVVPLVLLGHLVAIRRLLGMR